jgi:hypothetical protein
MMSKGSKAAATPESKVWIGRKLLITSAICFAGAIVSAHYLLKTRSEGNLDAGGRWAFLCLALYFAGMLCITLPLVRRGQERFAKRRELKRALEKEIELMRKFERKKAYRKH